MGNRNSGGAIIKPEHITITSTTKGNDIPTNGMTLSYKGAVVGPNDILINMGINNNSELRLSDGEVENINISSYAKRHFRGIKLVRKSPSKVYAEHNNKVIASITIKGHIIPENVIDWDVDRLTIYHTKNKEGYDVIIDNCNHSQQILLRLESNKGE